METLVNRIKFHDLTSSSSYLGEAFRHMFWVEEINFSEITQMKEWNDETASRLTSTRHPSQFPSQPWWDFLLEGWSRTKLRTLQQFSVVKFDVINVALHPQWDLKHDEDTSGDESIKQVSPLRPTEKNEFAAEWETFCQFSLTTVH